MAWGRGRKGKRRPDKTTENITFSPSRILDQVAAQSKWEEVNVIKKRSTSRNIVFVKPDFPSFSSCDESTKKK